MDCQFLHLQYVHFSNNFTGVTIENLLIIATVKPVNQDT